MQQAKPALRSAKPVDLKAFSVSFAHLRAAQIAREWKWNKEGEIYMKNWRVYKNKY